MTSTTSFKDTHSFLPTGFYDLLAYIIPASFLLFGIAIIFPEVLAVPSKLYKLSTNSLVHDVFSSFLAFGFLYTIGSILTSFSYILFQILITKIFDGVSLKCFGFERDFGNQLLAVLPLEQKSNEITKRYARLNLIRNVALSSLILMIVSFFSSECLITITFLIIFLISLVNTALRTIWLLQNIDKVKIDNKNRQN